MSYEQFKTDEIEGIVKKAKRKSVIRNIVISAISLIIFGFIFIISNSPILNWASQKAIEDNKLLYEITQPNVEIGAVNKEYGILSGRYTFNKYKLIEDKVVPWGTEQKTFNALGHNNPSGINDSVRVGETENEYRYYNPTNGQRSMLFYHPWFEYTNIQNDLKLIENVPNDAVMEVAISFDKPYSVSEVQEFFKLKNTITWYWVNDYNHNDREQLKGLHESGDTSSFVYGFKNKILQGKGDVVVQNEETYISTLNELKSKGNYDYIVDRLLKSAKQNKKEGLILGVVVTGNKEELLRLKEEKHIRAISLGVVARNY